MYNTYKIKEGDTLENISSQYGIDIEKIAAANGLDIGGELRIESELIIPEGNKDYFEIYTIKKGDTIYEIARRYNINPELLAGLNGLNNTDYIYPDQVIMIPKAGYSYYITKSGDTIDSVANIFGVSRDKLMNENEVMYLLEGQLITNKTR